MSDLSCNRELIYRVPSIQILRLVDNVHRVPPSLLYCVNIMPVVANCMHEPFWVRYIHEERPLAFIHLALMRRERLHVALGLRLESSGVM